jgi:uncharacterized delta-60 repeat protein
MEIATMANAQTGSVKFLVRLPLCVAVLAIAAGMTTSAQGLATSAPFFDGNGTPVAVAIQTDGRVVAAGSIIRTGAADTDFAVMRFNPDGTPDATFGIDGRVTTDISGTDDAARAIAIQADGRIVIAGITTIFPDPLCPTCPFTQVAVTRYTTAGALDVSFGVGGRVVHQNLNPTIPDTGYDAFAVSVAPNTDIFVGVWALSERFERLTPVTVRVNYLVRFAADGTQLTACCDTGRTGPSVLAPNPIAFDARGRMLMIGLQTPAMALHWGFLMRFTSEGAPDPTFGVNGFVEGPCTGTVLNTCTPLRNAVAVQPDDKAVVVGSASVMRWTAAGALDVGFGQAGVVTTPLETSFQSTDLRTVAIGANGWIVSAGAHGFVTTGGRDFAVVTTTSAGAVTQYATTDFGGDDYAEAIIVLASDTVVAAGLSRKADRTDIAWTRSELRTWQPLPASALKADFDGDRRADVAVVSAAGGWHISPSSSAFSSREAYRWGAAADIPVTADFDADGRTDVAVYRPSTGVWYVIDPRTLRQAAYQWGAFDYVPVPGDFDGDGRTELAVWRPGTGEWFTYNLVTGAIGHYLLGATGDVPIPRDYDGDGKTDLAVYRPSTGVWRVLHIPSGTSSEYQWGLTGDVPVPGDYTGDLRLDLAIYRPSNGTWWIFDLQTGTYFSAQWGAAGDQPVPADYIGDRRADLVVWRPGTGEWFIWDLATRTYVVVQLGGPGE